MCEKYVEVSKEEKTRKPHLFSSFTVIFLTINLLDKILH